MSRSDFDVRLRLRPRESRAAAVAAGRVAAWGIAIDVATKMAAFVLESAALPAAVAQAIIAEWGVGRLGVAWSDPRSAVPTTGAIARRAGIGAGIGIAAVAMVTGFLATTRAVVLDRTDAVAFSMVVALVSAGLHAMRDELLLHGLAIRALVSVEPGHAGVAKVMACGMTSAAAASAQLGATPAAIAVQGLLGMVFGALWVRDRGAWAAWGAHTAWSFATSMLLNGGFFEAHVASSAWGGGDAGALGGRAAVVALLPLALGALIGTASASAPPARAPREHAPREHAPSDQKTPKGPLN